MIEELNKYIEDKMRRCKTKDKKIAMQGILTGITLAQVVRTNEELEVIKKNFDQAICEIIKDGE